jgi:VanZ family protein
MPPPTAYNDRAYIWPVLLAIVIFVISGSQQLATPGLGFLFLEDKIAHFLIFGLVATSILRTPKFKDLSLRSLLITALITSAYGAFDEVRQSLTPGRRVEFADWLADTCGAFAAVTAYAKWHWYRHLLEWRMPIKGRSTQEQHFEDLDK